MALKVKIRRFLYFDVKKVSDPQRRKRKYFILPPFLVPGPFSKHALCVPGNVLNIPLILHVYFALSCLCFSFLDNFPVIFIKGP